MRPLSMVEDEGFQKMISTFNPKYTLPSRTYFTKLMEKKYEEIKAKLTNILKKCDSIALTADIWTSVATEAYLGVTGHFLGEDWEVKSHSLTTMHLEERHTAANIAEWLEDVIAKFDIPPKKIKAVVHDNGPRGPSTGLSGIQNPTCQSGLSQPATQSISESAALPFCFKSVEVNISRGCMEKHFPFSHRSQMRILVFHTARHFPALSNRSVSQQLPTIAENQ
ncbi:zinc finger BED domain-containing protein 1-like isoform X2 [Xyrichtys novacula]|nr:zinc finger BED domain-containing protein 1-like isoform X2 [Xyrichtys novacula]